MASEQIRSMFHAMPAMPLDLRESAEQFHEVFKISHMLRADMLVLLSQAAVDVSETSTPIIKVKESAIFVVYNLSQRDSPRNIQPLTTGVRLRLFSIIMQSFGSAIAGLEDAVDGVDPFTSSLISALESASGVLSHQTPQQTLAGLGNTLRQGYMRGAAATTRLITYHSPQVDQVSADLEEFVPFITKEEFLARSEVG